MLHDREDWAQIREELTSRWNKLTEEDLNKIDSTPRRLVGILMARYNYTNDIAKKEALNFSTNLKKLSEKNEGSQAPSADSRVIEQPGFPTDEVAPEGVNHFTGESSEKNEGPSAPSSNPRVIEQPGLPSDGVAPNVPHQHRTSVMEPIMSGWNHFLKDYQTSISATAVAAPGIMIVVTLVTYIGWWSDSRALVFGVLGGLLGWFLLTLIAKRYTTVHRANPLVCSELYARVENLQTRMSEASELREVCESQDEHILGINSSLKEMKTYIRSLEYALNVPSESRGVRD